MLFCQTPSYLHLANKYLLRHLLAHESILLGLCFTPKMVPTNLLQRQPTITTRTKNQSYPWFKSSCSLQPTVASFLAFQPVKPQGWLTPSQVQPNGFFSPIFCWKIGQLFDCLVLDFKVGFWGSHVSCGCFWDPHFNEKVNSPAVDGQKAT